MQCVVESAPESMSVSSGTHLMNEVKLLPPSDHDHISTCRSGFNTHTFSWWEEGRCLGLDSPPGTQNWGWLQQDHLSKKENCCNLKFSRSGINVFPTVRNALTGFSLAVAL